MKKVIIVGSISLILLIVVLFFLHQTNIFKIAFAPTQSSIPDSISDISQSQTETEQQPDIQVVAENLNVPWEIAFLSDQSFLVTERPGNLLHIYPEGQETIVVDGVYQTGEGGLLGMALDPNFEQNNYLYLYLTFQNGNQLQNQVNKYEFNAESNQLTFVKTVIDQIPGANYHDGGRVKFGPDGLLYITTGDAGQDQLAQDTNSLAGKILRITTEGKIPADNPFGNEVYSYGHRNPQGLAWDENNQLWASEHGPSGLASGNDEVNLIQAGNNYGWPSIKGQQTQEGMQTPIVESGSNETWAPAGITILNQQLLITGLRGNTLYQFQIEDQNLNNPQAHFRNQYGRLRFISLGPDGWLYLATSNTDGRGTPQENDDKIIKINPKILGLN